MIKIELYTEILKIPDFPTFSEKGALLANWGKNFPIETSF